MSKKSILGGIVLGILLTIMVGFGVCFLAFGNYGSGSSLADHQDNYAKAVRQIRQKAAATPPDAEAVWLYANLVQFRDPPDYKTLGLTYSQSESDAEFARLLDQAVRLGSRDAMVQKGMLLIDEGRDSEEMHRSDYESFNFSDPNKASQGFELLNQALKSSCELYAGHDSDTTYVSLSFVSDAGNIGSAVYELKDILKNTDLPNHPELQRKAAAFFLLEDIGCNDKDYLVRRLTENLLNKESLSFEQKVYDHTLAKLLGEHDVAYLLEKKVEPKRAAELAAQSQLLFDYFNNSHASTLKALHALKQQELEQPASLADM